jgi:hypothetical protein
VSRKLSKAAKTLESHLINLAMLWRSCYLLRVGNWTDAFPWIRFWALLLAANAGVCVN